MKEGGLKYNDPLNIWDRNIIRTAYNSVFEKSLRFYREQFHANSTDVRLSIIYHYATKQWPVNIFDICIKFIC